MVYFTTAEQSLNNPIFLRNAGELIFRDGIFLGAGESNTAPLTLYNLVVADYSFRASSQNSDTVFLRLFYGVSGYLRS